VQRHAGDPVPQYQINPLSTVASEAAKGSAIGLFGALFGLQMRAWYEGHYTSDLTVICKSLGVAFSEVPYTNSAATATLLVESEADLGLSLGNGYIAPEIFSIPKYGMINVHLERLPEYRNARSVIWPIYFSERVTGFTIHQIDKRIDGGGIIHKEELQILFHHRLEDTVRRTLESIVLRAPGAVRYVCENYKELAAAARRQKNSAKFTMPTLG
jgi:methionyl-tRNA formyltransferase